MLEAIAVHLILLIRGIRMGENSNSTNNARSKNWGPRDVEKRISKSLGGDWSLGIDPQHFSLYSFLEITSVQKQCQTANWGLFERDMANFVDLSSFGT